MLTFVDFMSVTHRVNVLYTEIVYIRTSQAHPRHNLSFDTRFCDFTDELPETNFIHSETVRCASMPTTNISD